MPVHRLARLIGGEEMGKPEAADDPYVGATRKQKEQAANALLKEHGCSGLVRPPRRPILYEHQLPVSQDGHEPSIEDLAESSGVEIGIPPEAIQLLIKRSTRAIYDEPGVNPKVQRRRIAVWILHESHLSNRDIAKRLKIHESAVSRDLKVARSLIYEHIRAHEAWYAIFCQTQRQAAQSVYHNPPEREPMDPEIQEDRAKLEERTGWQTWVLDEDIIDGGVGVRVVTKPPLPYDGMERENASHQFRLTKSKLSRLVVNGEVYISSREGYLSTDKN
jgi:hypothetical protein